MKQRQKNEAQKENSPEYSRMVFAREDNFAKKMSDN